MNYNDPRCIRLRAAYGIEGYGLLHCLLDMLEANGGSMPADFEAVAMHLSVSADMVQAVATQFNIFPPITDDGLLLHPATSASRSHTALSRTERARRAAMARWHKGEYQAQQQQATTTEQPPLHTSTTAGTNTSRPNPSASPPSNQTELDLDLPPAKPRTPAPLKQQAVAAWCDTYKAHFGIPYQVTPRDAGTIANILQRIQRTATQLGNANPSDSELLDTLKVFFQTALNDNFISENATLSLLSSQYNKIIKNIYASTTNPTQPNNPTARNGSRAARDNPAYLQDLYRRVAAAGGTGFTSNTG